MDNQKFDSLIIDKWYYMSLEASACVVLVGCCGYGFYKIYKYYKPTGSTFNSPLNEHICGDLVDERMVSLNEHICGDLVDECMVNLIEVNETIGKVIINDSASWWDWWFVNILFFL